MRPILAIFDLFLNALTIAIIIRAVLTWFPIRYDNPIVVFFHQVTEPFLAPLRRIIPRVGMLDITPMAAILLLYLIRMLISI
ncbi:MAG: YggT family protein [Dehalococcoidia bacterium]|nr:YggT family protein [Dehalococcoidia bacterium]MDZ4246115.1 YggT family protein [Dehalococcoidia bacterium]